jgi:hypothetical protein
MMARGKKSDEQPLFIDFVNCKFSNTSWSNFLTRIKKYFPQDIFKKLVSLLTSKYLFYPDGKPDANYFGNLLADNFMSVYPTQVLDEYNLKNNAELLLIQEIFYFQFIIKLALQQLSQKRAIDFKLLNIIAQYYNDGILKLIYKKNSCYSKDVAGFGIRGLIAYDLIEFVTNPDLRLQKLKRCDVCKKFFVTKTKAKARHCSPKCKNKFNNDRRGKSGKSARDTKKWRENNPGCY